MRAPLADYYAILGVARSASEEDLRRAFRALALQHHPDRAGPESTTTFQSIAEAYAVLSEPAARANYDSRLRTRQAAPQGPSRAEARGGSARGDGDGAGRASRFEEGEYQGPGGRIGWKRAAPRTAVPDRLDRLSGRLDDLLRAEIARRAADGVIEMVLTRAEAAVGGTVEIDAAVTVTCPTCSGLAEQNVLWCRRCDHAGTVIDNVTFALDLPPHTSDRTMFTFATDPTGTQPPLRIRLRVA